MTDQEILDGIKKLHEAMGHCSRSDMLRALRLGKARGRAIHLCRKYECPKCPRHQRPRLPKITQLRRTTRFGEEAGMDLLEVSLDEGGGTTSEVAGLNILDAHTGIQIVWPIRKPMASAEA